MAIDLAKVKEKIQGYLKEIMGDVDLDESGDFTFRQGSSQIFVRVREWDEQSSTVNIIAPTNFEVPLSAELFRYIATEANNFLFGRLSASEDEKGVMVSVSHTLLGDFLDFDELKWALYAVGKIADEIDDQIEAKFGGTKFHDHNA